MRILVTRPRADAEALVAALAARGHEALVAPMLEIRAPAPGAAPPDLDGVQALLFTSANGVRALAALTARRDLPVFAVGDASARAARAAGFARVESAGGDVADLVRLVLARCDPAAGALYHAAASRLAGDLKAALADAGFALRRDTLYESVAAQALPEALRAALASGRLDAATFFSPRTAATFVALVRDAGLAAACTRVTALCLSPAVAEALAPLAWRAVEVAAAPTQDSLLAALDRTVREASHDRTTGAGTIKGMSGDTPEATPQPGASGTPAAQSAGEAKEAQDTAQGPDAARRVIAQFGGIRPMASKLGVAVSTVQGWRERGSIPAARHDQIRAAAETHGIALDAAALAASDRSGESEPAAAPRTEAKEKGRTEAKAAPAVAAEKAKPADATATGGGEQPPERTPPPAESVRTTPGGLGPGAAFALGAAVLAVGVLLAVLARDAWLPLVGGGPGSEAGGGVSPARVAGLESRIAALESAPAPGLPAAAQKTLDGLAAKLDDVANQVASLAKADDTLGQDNAALRRDVDTLRHDLDAAAARLNAPDSLSPAEQKALDGLRGELGALDTRVGGLDDKIAALSAQRSSELQAAAGDLAAVLAVMQLRDALAGSAPFATELKTLKTLAAKRPDLKQAAAALAPIEPFADSGVPSLVTLEADFPAVARKVVAVAQAGEGEDWLAGVRRRLSSLVTVRPLGAVPGSAPADVVARAEALLGKDDLAGAVAQLDSLGGAPAAAAADWLARARARVAARAALVQLNAAVSEHLTAARG